MSESQSNIGNEEQSYEQSYQQQSQSYVPFEDSNAGIKSELHTIVDQLQRDEPPSEQKRRPLWQRVLMWAVPLWLVVFFGILSYNPRFDNCGGVKINYRQQTLCIANDKDFFVFVENIACDVIEKGSVMADSLQADSVAAETMQNYFSKYDFSIESVPIETEVLRGMRNAAYDSTSFCKNVAISFWNAGVRLLGEGKKDLACQYFNKLEQWKWRDSVLTASDEAIITRACYADMVPVEQTRKPKEVLKTKERVPSEPYRTVQRPAIPQVNIPTPRAATPSVSFVRKTDLQQIEQVNREQRGDEATQKGPLDPKQAIADPFEGQMVIVDGGTFMMGSNDKDAFDNEKPVHRVTLSRFAIGKYEVTQKQWRDVMGSDPPELGFKGCDNCPVERVSWNDIQEFLQKLNTLTKKNYRLPTEAEWEFAARGGIRNDPKTGNFKYAGSNKIDEVVWYGSNSGSKTHPVGLKKANQLGLFDMSGNVWEWCSDWYDENYYKNSPIQNPKGLSTGSSRVLRGGSWFRSGQDCRSARRGGNAPTYRDDGIGFRLVFVP